MLLLASVVSCGLSPSTLIASLAPKAAIQSVKDTSSIHSISISHLTLSSI